MVILIKIIHNIFKIAGNKIISAKLGLDPMTLCTRVQNVSPLARLQPCLVIFVTLTA
jgi:hypothetical protein